MYCGDGINDLAALAAADVGMAIGSSDASAVAPISDRHTSPAGRLCICIAHAFKLRNAMLVQPKTKKPGGGGGEHPMPKHLKRGIEIGGGPHQKKRD